MTDLHTGSAERKTKKIQDGIKYMYISRTNQNNPSMRSEFVLLTDLYSE